MWEGRSNFHALSQHQTPVPPCDHNPGRSSPFFTNEETRSSQRVSNLLKVPQLARTVPDFESKARVNQELELLITVNIASQLNSSKIYNI